RGNGAIDVLHAALGDGDDAAVVVRRQHVERPAVSGRDERAVDEKLVAHAGDGGHGDDLREASELSHRWTRMHTDRSNSKQVSTDRVGDQVKHPCTSVFICGYCLWRRLTG